MEESILFVFNLSQGIARMFGASHTALILPSLEDGLFEADYRIRNASVLLLMTVLEQILKANRMNVNSVDLMSAEIMPPERRAYVLSSLYIVRSDENAQVRQSSTSAWKNLVQNTPRTVRELLPILIQRLIHLLASASREKQVNLEKSASKNTRRAAGVVVAGDEQTCVHANMSKILMSSSNISFLMYLHFHLSPHVCSFPGLRLALHRRTGGEAWRPRPAGADADFL